MKKVIYAIVVVLVVTVAQSCVYVEDDLPPRGNSTRTFDFKNFTNLKMGSAFRVHVTAGSAYTVSATGERNDLDDLQIFVQDGELVARYEGSWSRRERMDIDIVMPTIAEVDFAGAVKAEITGFENLTKMNFELSGASNCDFRGSAKELAFDLTGASRLEVSGDGRYLDGELSGASQINAFDLRTEASDITLSGASSAKVWVTKSLKVDASGASSVRYKGSPDIEKQLSGGSTLRQE
jgi:hypothetical protein